MAFAASVLNLSSVWSSLLTSYNLGESVDPGSCSLDRPKSYHYTANVYNSITDKLWYFSVASTSKYSK